MLRYTLVFEDQFSGPLNRFDGKTGVWRDFPRRQKYIGNGPPSIYVNPGMTRRDGSALGLTAFKLDDGKLRISAGEIPELLLDDVHALLRNAGYSQGAVEKVRYYSGSLSTFSSWSQTYGYFEMRAKLPEGKGHWPAFWLVPSVNGWPPEIDIFEALGRENGSDGPGSPDNRLHMRVHFDEIAADGTYAPEPRLSNPFELEDGVPQRAIRRKHGNGTRYTFAKTVDVGQMFGRHIFDEFNVYGLSWTSDEITWWFGPTRDALQKVYRTPTPRDANGPMAIVFNNQIGGKWAKSPDPSAARETFESQFVIDYVRVFAQAPVHAFTSGAPCFSGRGGDELIVGNAASQSIRPGGGFDILTGGGGHDRFIVPGNGGSKIFTDFAPDDVLVLRDWSFHTFGEALSRITQVGNDLWLVDKQEGQPPQTLILRDLSVNDLTSANFDFGASE